MASNRKRKIGLWNSNPHCYWCGQNTVIYDYLPKGKAIPDNCATLDHLRSRLDPTRYEPAKPNEERTVLACFKCNVDRAEQERLSMTKEELRQRAQNGHIKKRGLSCETNS
jgi:hypothetical protein